MRLTWLKIDKFPNVQPGTELHFSDSFNILLGKNGSGKTSLLNLIVRILRSDFDGLQQDTFSIHYTF
ncbi:MAG: recombinational DNA repair ATPase RecF, partial [Myxococcota bacterium]